MRDMRDIPISCLRFKSAMERRWQRHAYWKETRPAEVGG